MFLRGYRDGFWDISYLLCPSVRSIITRRTDHFLPIDRAGQNSLDRRPYRILSPFIPPLTFIQLYHDQSAISNTVFLCRGTCCPPKILTIRRSPPESQYPVPHFLWVFPDFGRKRPESRWKQQISNGFLLLYFIDRYHRMAGLRLFDIQSHHLP